jgi:alpha-mannosidase
VDLSEGGYGVSLLNDCKYGHETNGQLMRLTLLKGSVYPDPEADLGDHDFTYVLYPHHDSWETAETIQHALNLNQGLTWYPISSPTGLSDQHSFLRCEAANVTLEAVKRTEDGQHLIVRLVERNNRHTRTALIFDRPLNEAWTCDLMENIEAPTTPEGNKLQIELKPYEILTVRVSLSSILLNAAR